LIVTLILRGKALASCVFDLRFPEPDYLCYSSFGDVKFMGFDPYKLAIRRTRKIYKKRKKANRL